MTSYTRYPRAILWLVPGGRFTVGGTAESAEPSLEVEVGPFYLSKTPITNRQFEAFDRDFRRSPASAGDDDTAVGVSLDEAVAYCAWYAGVARKPIRLPTEIEWEHACRGGTATRYFFGDDAAAADPFVWDAENSGGALGSLTRKKPNPFGLLGMLGGVWEWTSSSDPSHPGRRILRGGSFRVSREAMGSAVRRPADPATAQDDIGFRILREFGG